MNSKGSRLSIGSVGIVEALWNTSLDALDLTGRLEPNIAQPLVNGNVANLCAVTVAIQFGYKRTDPALPPLKATIEDCLVEKVSAQRRRYARRRAEGLCARCDHLADAGTPLCGTCKAKKREALWQWRQRQPHASRAGPAPRDWNFETDDLIVEHIVTAKKMARWAYQKLPSSTSIDINDVESDALLGLVIAGRKYDAERGPFKKWALTNIRSEVYRGFRTWTHGSMKQPPRFEQLPEWE